MNLRLLNEKALIVRRDIIDMLYKSKSGHPGGSLSAVEILVYLYFEKMNINPENPIMDNRDRFVLSKGHGAPVLYAVLAEKGFFPKKELDTLRKINSILQGHPACRYTPGVEVSTGSLGQGISASCGIALAGKISGKDYKTYVLIGDGEMQEGIVWEAAMFAAHYKLNNLIAFLDHNGLQIDGRNDDVMKVSPVADKWKAFGWNVVEIDGHSFEEIENAVKQCEKNEDKPSIIIARTVKGKGISFMENQAGWHGKAPNSEEYEIAVKELGGDL